MEHGALSKQAPEIRLYRVTLVVVYKLSIQDCLVFYIGPEFVDDHQSTWLQVISGWLLLSKTSIIFWGPLQNY